MFELNIKKYLANFEVTFKYSQTLIFITNLKYNYCYTILALMCNVWTINLYVFVVLFEIYKHILTENVNNATGITWKVHLEVYFLCVQWMSHIRILVQLLWNPPPWRSPIIQIQQNPKGSAPRLNLNSQMKFEGWFKPTYLRP